MASTSAASAAASRSRAAAIQTILLSSVRGLRRRRLGHISPADYPRNGLDKWGLATRVTTPPGGGSYNNGGGGGGRPAPRASLVLGGLTNSRNNNGGGVCGGNNNNGYYNNRRRKFSDILSDHQHQPNSYYATRGVAAAELCNLNSSTAVSSSTEIRMQYLSQTAAAATTTKIHNDDDGKSHNNNSSDINRRRKYESDLIVVLDMDECLIHSQFLSNPKNNTDDKYRQIEDRPNNNSNDGNNTNNNSANESSNTNNDNVGNNTNNTATNTTTTTTTNSTTTWSTGDSLVLNACDSFRITLPDGDIVNVNKRPNLDSFLSAITSRYETYIFTAAMEIYAKPVLNILDPNGTMFSGILYRESCVYDPILGVYSKNLCDVLRLRQQQQQQQHQQYDEQHDEQQLISDDDDDEHDHEHDGIIVPTIRANISATCGINGTNDQSNITVAQPTTTPAAAATAIFECDERRVVLVDNNPLSFIPNPSNGILVSSFYDDPKDDTLEAVMELLYELDEYNDVRPILDDKFGLKDALDDVVKGGGTNNW